MGVLLMGCCDCLTVADLQALVLANSTDTNTTYVLGAGPGPSDLTLTGSDGSAFTVDVCGLVGGCDVSGGGDGYTTISTGGDGSVTITTFDADGVQTGQATFGPDAVLSCADVIACMGGSVSTVTGGATGPWTFTQTDGTTATIPAPLPGAVNVAFVDSGDGCTPEPLTEFTAEMVGATTHNAMGDEWEWIGTGWVLVSVNPCRWLENTVALSPLLDDAALGALPSGTNLFDERCLSITNDDCVPWYIRLSARWAFQGVVVAGNMLRARVFGENVPGGFNGTNFITIDTTCNPTGCRANFGNTPVHANGNRIYRLDPGSTWEPCVQIDLRMVSYVSDPNNQLNAANFGLTAEITRGDLIGCTARALAATNPAFAVVP